MSAFRAERPAARSRADVARQLGEALLAALELACAGLAGVPTSPAGSGEPLRFLDLDEVGGRIGLSRSSVEALVARGVFTPVKQGRSLRVPSTDVLAYQQRLIRESGGDLPGESAAPIDFRRSSRQPAAPSAAAPHRAADRKARQSR